MIEILLTSNERMQTGMSVGDGKRRLGINGRVGEDSSITGADALLIDQCGR